MAVSRFATNNLVAEHDVYVKYLEVRKKFIEEHGWTNVKEFVPARCGLFDIFHNVPKTTLQRGLYKWHCMQISYDIWQTLVKHCVVWEGAIEYKKSVHVDVSILKKFKSMTEQAIHDARCDYNTWLPHGQATYDACRYLAMYWTYLDIIVDTKTQRYFPDKETREKAAIVFGYDKSDNPFQMNGMYWTRGKNNIQDAQVEEKTMEEKNYSKDWFSTLLVDIIDDARLTNPLYRAGIQTVGQFVEKSDKELLKIRTFGVVKLRKVKEALEKAGKKYIVDISEEKPKEVFNDDLGAKYDELLIAYNAVCEQKLECEAHNSSLRDEISNLKDKYDGIVAHNNQLRVASDPKNFDTFTLLNIVLEKMKDAKMDNIFITVDGMTVDIHKKFEHPFGKAESYTIRTREAR